MSNPYYLLRICSLAVLLMSCSMAARNAGDLQEEGKTEVSRRISSIRSEGETPIVQESIAGPLLGYVFDSEKNEFRSILGIPGSSLLGSHLPVAFPVSRTWISPQQNYALAETVDGGIVLIPFQDATISTLPLEISSGPGKRIAINSAGDSAIIWHEGRRSLQQVDGLPSSPVIREERDLSSLPGTVTALAIADDKSLVLIGSGTPVSATLYRLEAGAEPQEIFYCRSISAVSLMPHTQTALLTDRVSGQVFRVDAAADQAKATSLDGFQQSISEPSAIEASVDGMKIFVAGGNGVAVMDLASGEITALQREGQSGGLFRLSGDSGFRLNETSDGPICLVQANQEAPRLLYVPMEPRKVIRSRRTEERRLP